MFFLVAIFFIAFFLLCLKEIDFAYIFTAVGLRNNKSLKIMTFPAELTKHEAMFKTMPRFE